MDFGCKVTFTYPLTLSILFHSETAINIGYSCMLLTENMIDVFVLKGDDKNTIQEQIELFQTKIDTFSPKTSLNGDNDVQLKGFVQNSGEGHVKFSENEVSVLLKSINYSRNNLTVELHQNKIDTYSPKSSLNRENAVQLFKHGCKGHVTFPEKKWVSFQNLSFNQ